MKKQKEYLAIYSSACLTCKSLVEGAIISNPDCHYRTGNAQCPASEVRIAVVGEALSYAQRVLRARDGRKSKTEAKLMEHVSKQSSAFKTKFYTYLENGAEL